MAASSNNIVPAIRCQIKQSQVSCFFFFFFFRFQFLAETQHKIIIKLKRMALEEGGGGITARVVDGFVLPHQGDGNRGGDAPK